MLFERRSHWCRLMVVLTLMSTAPAALAQTQSQQQGAPQQGASNALAMEIIGAWQGSSRGPAPKDRITLIEKALSLAVPANPWPFKEPARDNLLGQMWGQLGNEYRRIDGVEQPEALERALKAYTEALKHVPRQRPSDWGRVQYGIGSVYVDRIAGDRAGNIENAIMAFNNVAEVMTKATAPSLWGSVQISLSRAYWHRIKGLRADNMEQSIAAADAALSVFGRDKEPGDWSGAQQALGAAYWGRVRGSRADNVERALAAYEQSLTVLSPERQPKAWAGVQDNIGMAYGERVRGERSENVTKSAAAFEAASKIFTRERFPSEWAQLNMNFANLLLDDEAGAATDRLERAIGRYDDALTVYTRERYPERWARVMLNLGIAYASRMKGDRSENMEKAIAAYQGALQVYKRESEPLKWSIAQGNLASALRRRSKGDRAANLAAAAAAADLALSVQTLAAYPAMHLRTAAQAGQIASVRGDWRTASGYFARAIEASNLLMGQGLDAVRTRQIVSEGATLFGAAAYAAVRQNEVEKAVDLLDLGKARLLKVALGLDALSLLPAERTRLDALRAEIAGLENSIELTEGGERLAAIEALEKHRSAVGAIVAAAAGRPGDDPTHARGSAIAGSLLTRYAAIAMPLVTEHGAILLLRTRGAGGSAFQAVPLAGLDATALERVLQNPDPSKPGGGWLDAYAINNLPPDQQAARRQEWEGAVAGLAPALERLVGTAFAAALARAGVAENANVLWVPTGGLGLLPVGLATEAANGRTLLDRYTMTIAPSLASAEVARLRTEKPAPAASLAAIVNPTGDLQFTEPEGAVATSHFKGGPKLFDAKTATEANVLAALGKASHWHFATHGKFFPRQPRQSAVYLADGAALTMGTLLDRADLGTPRLVVLSACETGLVEVGYAPEEFTGLPSAFLQAGAAGVVASLWPVDDVSTALLMMRFYDQHFGAKLPPAAALRAAQIWLRDATREQLITFVAETMKAGRVSKAHETLLMGPLEKFQTGEKPYRHPLHWAAFQYYGG